MNNIAKYHGLGTGGGGDTLTIICYTCGMPSSTEWAKRVRANHSGHSGKSYFPFLLEIVPPVGAVIREDGSTYLCAFCHASLESQWRDYEQKGDNTIHPSARKYAIHKFICAVCGVQTYRKRVRALPFDEFPFLANDHKRPVGSITLGDNPLAVCCLDCSETLWAQASEYDRWGLPIAKRHFNWLTRPPPPENSLESTVARLPSGETQLPRCPPTEPILTPRHRTEQPEPIVHHSRSSRNHKSSRSDGSPVYSQADSPVDHHKSHRKISVPSMRNSASPSSVGSPHSQPPIVTVAPMSAHHGTMTNSRKEHVTIPSGGSQYPKYDNPVRAQSPSLPPPPPLFPRYASSATFSPYAWASRDQHPLGENPYTHVYQTGLESLQAAAQQQQAHGAWPTWPSSEIFRYNPYLPSYQNHIGIKVATPYYCHPLYPDPSRISPPPPQQQQSQQTPAYLAPLLSSKVSSSQQHESRSSHHQNRVTPPSKSFISSQVDSSHNSHSEDESHPTPENLRKSSSTSKSNLNKSSHHQRTPGSPKKLMYKEIISRHHEEQQQQQHHDEERSSRTIPYEKSDHSSQKPFTEKVTTTSSSHKQEVTMPKKWQWQNRNATTTKSHAVIEATHSRNDQIEPINLSSSPTPETVKRKISSADKEKSSEQVEIPNKKSRLLESAGNYVIDLSNSKPTSQSGSSKFMIAYLCPTPEKVEESEEMNEKDQNSSSENEKTKVDSRSSVIVSVQPMQKVEATIEEIEENKCDSIIQEVTETATTQEVDTSNVCNEIVKRDVHRDESARELVQQILYQEKKEKRNDLKAKLKQLEFLQGLGLISRKKRTELELQILISRADRLTLPPLKFRTTTSTKMEINDEIKKILLQSAFIDFSMLDTKVDPNEISFAKALGLSPATSQDKEDCETKWRLKLAERMIRERRNISYCGIPHLWDSVPNISNMVNLPTVISNSTELMELSHFQQEKQHQHPTILKSLSLTLPSDDTHNISCADLLTTVDGQRNTTLDLKVTVTHLPLSPISTSVIRNGMSILIPKYVPRLVARVIADQSTNTTDGSEQEFHHQQSESKSRDNNKEKIDSGRTENILKVPSIPQSSTSARRKSVQSQSSGLDSDFNVSSPEGESESKIPTTLEFAITSHISSRTKLQEELQSYVKSELPLSKNQLKEMREIYKSLRKNIRTEQCELKEMDKIIKNKEKEITDRLKTFSKCK